MFFFHWIYFFYNKVSLFNVPGKEAFIFFISSNELFSHLLCTHQKKFDFVLYIYYWQLQVGPDHPRPDEPQRVLICRQIQDLAPEAAASPTDK